MMNQEPQCKESTVQSPIPSVSILGVRLHSITMAQTIEILTTMALSGRPHHVVTVNPEFVMTAQRDSGFRSVLNNAHLAIPDGIGVVWAARLFGLPLRERIAGVDAVENLAAVAEKKNLSMFLLGAGPGVAEKAAAELLSRHPGLRIAGTYAGSPREEEEDEIVERITATRPNFLFVAYGAPKQDLWIRRNFSRLNVPVMVGVGGTLDYIAGVAVRAPQLIRSIGLEWLHRLFREPHRWRRMLALPRFAVAVVLARIYTQKTRMDTGATG